MGPNAVNVQYKYKHHRQYCNSWNFYNINFDNDTIMIMIREGFQKKSSAFVGKYDYYL